MTWKISGLLTAIIALGLLNPLGALADAYEGMCSDAVTITTPAKCKTPSFVEVSVVATTDCKFLEDPKCPNGQSLLGMEECGFEGWGKEAICEETCTEFSECLDCFSGYYGSECEGDCNCPNNTACNDGIDGDGFCECSPNWTGLNCNECAPNHFGNNCKECACGDTAICDDGVEGDGSCSCNDGYHLEGEDCVNINECSPPPILVCIDVNPSQGCPYEACEEAVGILDSVCVNDNWDKFCEECAASMITDEADCSSLGDACTVPAPLPCTANNSYCQDTEGSYLCACSPGYEGDGTLCKNVNECEVGLANCSSFATCTDQPGNYSCACNDGFEGDGVTCTDINECETEANLCSENATCTNQTGNFSCSCNAQTLQEKGAWPQEDCWSLDFGLCAIKQVCWRYHWHKSKFHQSPSYWWSC